MGFVQRMSPAERERRMMEMHDYQPARYNRGYSDHPVATPFAATLPDSSQRRFRTTTLSDNPRLEEDTFAGIQPTSERSYRPQTQSLEEQPRRAPTRSTSIGEAWNLQVDSVSRGDGPKSWPKGLTLGPAQSTSGGQKQSVTVELHKSLDPYPP